MNSRPSTNSATPIGRDTLPQPDGWRAVAMGGGGLAGCGFGMLLLTAFVLLLLAANLGSVIAGFFYGGVIFELPIGVAFLIVLMVLGARSALRQYEASGNRIPALSFGGYVGVGLVVAIAFATVGYYSAIEAKRQQGLRNDLRQRYGYLYYTNAVSDKDHAERMRTTDSYQTVSDFYKQMPLCDATKIASGGGTFIIPCHTPGGTPSDRIYLRINSRVDNNIPCLIIDTTTEFEW